MREAFVIVDDVNVYRNKMVARGSWNRFNPRYCALCEREIDDGEEVSLLMCNGVLFPNIWVHDNHFIDNGRQHINMVRGLARRYEAFVKQWESRKIWGHYG